MALRRGDEMRLRYVSMGSASSSTSRKPVFQWEGTTGASSVKLLKLLPAFACGGTERQAANLARMIDCSRFALGFACLKRWGYFLKEVEEHEIPVAEYPINRLYGPRALWQQVRLGRDMRNSGIDILHSYNFYANVFAILVARMAGVPVIIASIRDEGIYLTRTQAHVQKLCCRFADCVLVNAHSIRKWLVSEGYRAEKIFVIENGIDLSRFEHKASGSRIRQELGVPEDAPLVVMLARLNPQKGIDYFLKAAAEIGHRCQKTRFLVVGDKLISRNGQVMRDAEYIDQLERYAARLGLGDRLIFTGFRDDVPELLSEAAVSILPSFSEGLSNTLLESMAAGVPVVATRVGGNPEVVTDGKTGFLVPPRDVGALVEATMSIVNDPDLGRRMGAEARRQAIARFSLDRMVRETEDLYLRLLGQKRKLRGLRRASMGKALNEVQ